VNKTKPRTYLVQLTDEQITLIRAMELRREMMWFRHEAALSLDDEGNVIRMMIVTCQFCGRGASNGTDIQHQKKCLIPLAEKEWEAMNAQFIDVLNAEEQAGDEPH
jgi:hypothetical protein